MLIKSKRVDISTKSGTLLTCLRSQTNAPFKQHAKNAFNKKETMGMIPTNPETLQTQH